jgi:predicted esterase
VEQLVQQQVEAGIPSASIAVGGFSQGGAMALLMLRSRHRLAGVAALSAYLPMHEQRPLVSGAPKGGASVRLLSSAWSAVGAACLLLLLLGRPLSRPRR